MTRSITLSESPKDIGRCAVQWSGLVGGTLTNKRFSVSSNNPNVTLLFADTNATTTISESASIIARLKSSPQPSLTSISPQSAVMNSPGLILRVTGANFAPSSVVQWNGQARATTFESSTQLRAEITATDLAGTEDVSTALVTVYTPPPGGGLSAAQPFTLRSDQIANVNSATAQVGQTVTVSATAAQAGDAGIVASLTNNTPGSSAATVTAATYYTNPTASLLFYAGARYVDLRVVGADAGDSVAARFYYPVTVTGAAENSLQLFYWTGSVWAPVRSSGNLLPPKDLTDNLDGTLSGGRFTVTFDGTSAPPVTGLGGTVFVTTLPQDELHLANAIIRAGEVQQFRAITQITAGPSFVIEAGATATFQAGAEVRLQTGFSAKAGSAFHAVVGEARP